jgi:hypothetical protein
VGYSEATTYTYDVSPRSEIHATDTTGEGDGGKSARDGNLLCEGRG